jgi:hypothetical protein
MAKGPSGIRSRLSRSLGGGPNAKIISVACQQLPAGLAIKRQPAVGRLGCTVEPPVIPREIAAVQKSHLSFARPTRTCRPHVSRDESTMSRPMGDAGRDDYSAIGAAVS